MSVKPVPFKKNWVLTQDAFKTLLACLDPDEECAGRKYENIRQALITFFECRGSSSAEDQADETINRVARRLAEGKEIYVKNPSSYFYGVARNVLKESWEAATTSVPVERLPSSSDFSDDPVSDEWRFECLEQCLKGLAPQDRDIISEYYRGETRIKIHNRKLLAEQLGVPLNALRIRAFRIRERLEACVQRHLKQIADG